MNILDIILLQDVAPGGFFGNEGLKTIMMFAIIIGIFYFFMIRPQQKRQKELLQKREAMKPGDRVVTAGGIYGKIREIGDVYMMIEIADGVKIRVDKSQIFESPEDSQQTK
ncbi:MAG: preprotein translocase subunit YajC [Tannerellaceae bacterium]|nr:preprotein translocase subunit YajC [Tannerellaceae bacterium]